MERGVVVRGNGVGEREGELVKGLENWERSEGGG